MATAIETIQRHAKRIARGKDPKVKPGAPVAFTAACVEGDAVRQGDLYLTIAESPPEGFVLVTNTTDLDRQLVPGNTEGSKHCLDSLKGVELWRPRDWNEESLTGPFLRLSEDRTVLHPTHGAVLCLAGFGVQCDYQREYDKEQAKERRARD